MSDLKLFTPYEGPFLSTPHRVAMPAMTRNRAGENRCPNEMIASYYVQRVSAGLMVSEATDISPRAVGYPGTPGWYTDEQKAGWKMVVEKVRAAQSAPAPFFNQLFHTGRVSHTKFQPNGDPPQAPSAIASGVELFTGAGMEAASTPAALTKDGIASVIADYVAAGKAAIEAGFDGVEINGGNGYLIDQFLRDGTNKRDDEYGGDAKNRIRFLLEVTDTLIAALGDGKVAVRVSPVNTTNNVSESDPKGLFTALADALEDRKLAYLHVIEAADAPEVTRAMREVFKGTLVVNDGYDRDKAEKAIATGLADIVSFGRPFIANPDLPRRLREGAALNEADVATFYGGAEPGYTDYATLD